MMAGITSPARPWFQLGTLDPELAEYGPVKTYLHDVAMKMREVFAQSNLYNALHTTYLELGVFGTAPVGLYFDFDNVIRSVPYTVGSYLLAANGKNEIDTFYREYQFTVGQLVKAYGLGAVSQSVKDNWNRGNTETWVDVCHVIEPDDASDKMPTSGMPFRSVYFEKNQTRDDFLKLSGFKGFPILAPRWDAVGEDIYATNCPGMDAIGDVKSLQLSARRKAQALDKVVDPPLQVPIALRGFAKEGGFQPGDMEFVADTGNGIRSMYDFRPDLNAIGMEIREDEDRINRAFYVDLFLMLANSDRRQITAREIEEKHEEKLLMLGPVLERLHHELLNPLIKRTYNIMNDALMLPPPPPELAQSELNVEYISVLAQAQKLTAVTGLERLSTYAMNVAQVWPDARHKFDAMQSIDEYAAAVGVAPRVIRDDMAAEQFAMAEQQAIQAQQAAAMAQPAAATAKTMSETDIESPSALTRAMGLA